MARSSRNAPKGEVVHDVLRHDLFEQVRRGSEIAAWTIYERYRELVLALIHRDFLPRSHSLGGLIDSEDLAQETWIALFEAMKKGAEFPGEGAFVEWMKATARHVFLNAVRSHVLAQKRSRDRVSPYPTNRLRMVAPGPGPEAEIDWIDEWDQFTDTLPAACQAVVGGLRAGHSRNEIAAELKCKEWIVQRFITHVRKKWLKREREREKVAWALASPWIFFKTSAPQHGADHGSTVSPIR